MMRLVVSSTKLEHWYSVENKPWFLPPSLHACVRIFSSCVARYKRRGENVSMKFPAEEIEKRVCHRLPSLVMCVCVPGVRSTFHEREELRAEKRHSA